MRKILFTITGIVLAFIGQAQGIYNDNARIVSENGTCWVVDGGNFTLTSQSASNLATLANLKIFPDASLTIDSKSFLTVNGTLTNNAGNAGFVIESNAVGTGSLLHNADNVPTTIKRYITGNPLLDQRAYHQVAIPLESDNLQAGLFSGSYLFRFDISTQNWKGLGSNAAAPLDKNFGYLVYYPNISTTYSLPGNMRNGNITLLSSVGALNNFFLVPNPYPSAIDWDASSGWIKTNLYDAIWIWNPVAKNYAAYGTEAGINNATSIIPQGQSFFVKAEIAGVSLALNNNVRVHNSKAFYKSVNTSENLLRVAASANNSSDEVVVRFRADASVFADYFDVTKMKGDNFAPQLSTQAGEESLSINTLPRNLDQTVVPMNFETQFIGSVRLSISGIDSFDPTLSIYLQDELTGQTINLRTQQIYTFNHNPGNAANRFKLVFGGTIGIGEISSDVNKMWITGNTVFINAPELNGQQANVEVFNTEGQRLVTKLLILDDFTTLSLNSKGFVIVKLTARQKVLSTKGILMY